MENGLEQQVLAKAQKWLDGNYDAETKKQVKYLMDNDMKELVESFYKDLEFGMPWAVRGISQSTEKFFRVMFWQRSKVKGCIRPCMINSEPLPSIVRLLT